MMQLSLLEFQPLNSAEEIYSIQNQINKLKKAYNRFLKIARTADGEEARMAVMFANSLKEEEERLEKEVSSQRR